MEIEEPYTPSGHLEELALEYGRNYAVAQALRREAPLLPGIKVGPKRG